MSFKDWLKTRPPCVRDLAAEFPMATTRVEVEGQLHYLVGYTENDMLIVTPIDPAGDYDAAVEARRYLCARHLRASRRAS